MLTRIEKNGVENTQQKRWGISLPAPVTKYSDLTRARNAAKFGARSRQKPNPKRHAFKSFEPERLKKLRQLL